MATNTSTELLSKERKVPLGPKAKNAFLLLAIALFLTSSAAQGRVPGQGGTVSGLGVVAYENGNAESHPADAPDASPLSSSVSLSISSQGTIAYPSAIGWLHTDGRWIKDASGNIVLLTGVNCYIRLQNERAKFEAAKAAGAKAIRLTLWVTDIEGPFTSDPNEDRSGIPAIDNAVAWCKELGLQVIFHQGCWGPYGSYANVWPAPIDFWTSPTLQQKWLDMWTTLVTRYKGEPTVVGIDLMDEPYMTGQYGTPPTNAEAIWEGIAKNAITELKAINPNLLFIVEDWGLGNQWVDTDFLKNNNCIYSPHLYYDDKQWTDWGKAYVAGDFASGKQLLSQWIDKYYMVYANKAIPVWIGETGFLSNQPNWKAELDDELTLFEQKGVGYSIYTYADPYTEPYDMNTKSGGYQLTVVGQAVSAHLHSPS